MKLELNKFYRTRSGHKARIYALDGVESKYNASTHGAVLDYDPLHLGWLVCSWNPNGLYKNGAYENELDIISEWQEPKPRLYAWIGMWPSNCGYVVFSEKKDDCPNIPLGASADRIAWRRASWLDEPEEK